MVPRGITAPDAVVIVRGQVDDSIGLATSRVLRQKKVSESEVSRLFVTVSRR